MSGCNLPTHFALLPIGWWGSTSPQRNQHMKVVNNEAGYVERLGLTDVKHEMVASLILDCFDKRVKAIICMAATYNLAVRKPIVKNRQNVLQLSIEVAFCWNANLIGKLEFTSSKELRRVSVVVAVESSTSHHHWLIMISRESQRLPGLIHQSTTELALDSWRVELLLTTDKARRWSETRGHLRLLRAWVWLQFSVGVRSYMWLLALKLATHVLRLCNLASTEMSLHHHLLRSLTSRTHHHRLSQRLLLIVWASSVVLLHLVVACGSGSHLHHLIEVIVLVHCWKYVKVLLKAFKVKMLVL